MPAGCLFDLDGLLLDTEPLHGQAWAEAVGQFGGSASTELLLGLRGRNKFDNASGLIEALQLTVSVEQLLAVRGVSAVFYDITPKPPATTEFE